MSKEFENKRYTTIVEMREVVNCVTGEKTQFPNKYFVYDNAKKCNVMIEGFKPTSYQEIHNKAIEMNSLIPA